MTREPQADGVRPVEAGTGEAELVSPSRPASGSKPVGPYVRIEAGGGSPPAWREQTFPSLTRKSGPGKEVDAAPHADAVRHADKRLAGKWM